MSWLKVWEILNLDLHSSTKPSFSWINLSNLQWLDFSYLRRREGALIPILSSFKDFSKPKKAECERAGVQFLFIFVNTNTILLQYNTILLTPKISVGEPGMLRYTLAHKLHFAHRQLLGLPWIYILKSQSVGERNRVLSFRLGTLTVVQTQRTEKIQQKSERQKTKPLTLGLPGQKTALLDRQGSSHK